jgi:putative FmdB family regulatory protein
MPLYEYQCDECGHTFEKIQKFSDPLEDTCPKCGGPVRKLVSSPAIQFKGSGFYITDYAKKDSGSQSGEAKSDTPSTDKEKGTSAEKAEKTEKTTEKSEKSDKSEKSTTTETAKPSSSDASATSTNAPKKHAR